MSAITTTAAVPAQRERRKLLRRLGARPPAMRSYQYVHVVLFLGALVLGRELLVSGEAGQLRYDTFIYYSVLVVGFYFIFGLAGQFAFSQAAFAAVGGYSSAWATREGSSFIVGLLFGVAIAIAISFGFAWLARRASLFFLAIATLGLSEIILRVIEHWKDLGGFEGGQIINIAKIELFGQQFDNENIFWLLAVALGVVLLMGVWMARSPVNREAIALRDQDVVASTLGVPTLRIRISMFVLGSAIGAAAGSIFVHWKGFASLDDFDISLGLGIFIMLIVGGIDSLWGPILGAGFYVFVPYWITEDPTPTGLIVLALGGGLVLAAVRNRAQRAGMIGGAIAMFILAMGILWAIPREDLDRYTQIFYGIVLLVTMILFPQGLVGFFWMLRNILRREAARRQQRNWLTHLLGLTRRTPEETAPAVPEPVIPEPSVEARLAAVERGGATLDGAAILRATDIAVSFGGVRAVDGVSLDLAPGEILGLVGPNGSGKTTFLNAVIGVVPASGRLEINGTRVRLGAPRKVRKLSVLRTYQAPQTYVHLSCLEDVLLSSSDRRYTGILASWFARTLVLAHERRRWAHAMDALERVGLGELAEQPAGRLTYGQRRLLELARAIAADPAVLLLDEPSAGLDASETEHLSMYLRELRDEGVSLLVIDHKLDFITGLCDRVAVLELGHLVAVGPADTVFADQRVVDAYLGVAETAEA